MRNFKVLNSSNIKNIIVLQLIIMFYTTTGIMAKKASAQEFLSKEYIMYYMFEIAVLGVYAIVWQQIIKKFDISIAYANKGLSILWFLLWSVIFFNETITLNNIIGSIIIIIGMAVVNKHD